MTSAGHHDELLSMADGDPGVAEVMRAMLRTIRDGADDARLRELADAVLDGSQSLREAARSDAFGVALAEHARALHRWRAAAGAVAVADQAKAAEQLIAALNHRFEGRVTSDDR
jgi:hypothetical protein